MSHLTISCFLAFIISFLNAIFISLHKPRTPLKKIWILFSFTVASWTFCFYKASLSTSYDVALFWTRIQNASGILIPLFFFHFVLLLTGLAQIKKLELKIYYCLVLGYFASCLIFPSNFVSHVSPKLSILYYTNGGILYYPLPVILFFLVTYGSILLLKTYKAASRIKRNQIKYVFLGTFIGFLGGGSSLFLSFDIPIYPLGMYLVPIYVATTSYAIIKHQLMDMRIVIQKSIIYSISIATISILYLLSIFVLEKLAQEIFGYQSIVISITTAFALGLLFIPIRYKVQHLMDRHFFKGSTPEISDQNEQLRQELIQSEKYKTLSTLATGIAHEIKNPLTAIQTFTEYLPSRLDDKEFLTKFSNIVNREVNRINELVHQLLHYGKPAPLSIQNTDIHKLIAETIDVLNNKFLTHKINILTHLTAKSRYLSIDPNQIKQALLNIFLNAIDAMPKGGNLTVSTLITETSYFIIEVEDTGAGISKEDLSQIFDPFFSKKDHGTGLGLSITQSLIENHKGIIQIRSKVGGGSVVTVELPVKDNDSHSKTVSF